jgi:hypothetical protein
VRRHVRLSQCWRWAGMVCLQRAPNAIARSAGVFLSWRTENEVVWNARQAEIAGYAIV